LSIADLPPRLPEKKLKPRANPYGIALQPLIPFGVLTKVLFIFSDDSYAYVVIFLFLFTEFRIEFPNFFSILDVSRMWNNSMGF